MLREGIFPATIDTTTHLPEDDDPSVGEPRRTGAAAALARARAALEAAERKHALGDRTIESALPTSRPPRTRERRPPLVSAWLDTWFRTPEGMDRVRAMAREAKGKWKGAQAWGQFSGWVSERGRMPVRVDGFWDPPDLSGDCSACGRGERCEHIVALALRLEEGAATPPPAPEEIEVPCLPKLVLGRWAGGSKSRKAQIPDAARLSFRYGPREIDEHERVQTLSWSGPEGTVRCRRDVGAELSFRERLDALGWTREGLSASRHHHGLSLETTLDFLENQAPLLREEGWDVEVHHSMDLKVLTVDDWSGSWTEHDDGWFSMALHIEAGGQRLDVVDICRQIVSAGSIEGLLSHLSSGGSVTVRTPKGYLRLPGERMLPILSGLAFLLSGEGKALRVPRLLAAGLGELGLGEAAWSGSDELARLRERLGSVAAPQAVALPEGVRATLRPYQESGLAWLQWLRENGFGGILADDMGLGKTLQTIAHIACEQAAGRLDRPCLVVCPTSVAPNWADEIAKFAPFLDVVLLHGSRRHDLREVADRAHVVVTTYSLLPRDESWLCDRNWHMVVLDEAQTLKNARTQARAVVGRIPARTRLALTGTPMENHLGELWSLFDLLLPGLLGTERHFSKHVRPRIERLGDEDLRDRLRQVVSPFLLRRTKNEVASELPEKTEIVVGVDLEGRQRDLYETVRAAQDKRLRQVVAGSGIEGATIQVLEALLRLRQTCCDPRLLPEEMSKGCEVSAKLDWVATHLPEMVEEGRRVLVFSQFTGLLDLVEPILRESGIAHVRLDGSTADRGAVVKAFQAGEAPVFLLSLKAGGTGLNLVAADTVVFLDPWWNPAVEAQAMDRAHRIGQTRAVFVYKLVARGTVEEKILALQGRKAELAASILEGGGAASLRFTTEDLADLLTPLE